MRSILLLICSLLLASLSAQSNLRHEENPAKVSPKTHVACDTPATFIKKFGSAETSELGHSMCLSADGNIYIAGQQGANPMIAKITPDGNPIWVRTMPAPNSSEPIKFAEIIEDSEGKLVLCGTEGDFTSSRNTIVLRYDPVSNVVIWFQRISSQNPGAFGIIENGSGGNFILYTYTLAPITSLGLWRAELWDISRTGGIGSGPTIRYGDEILNYRFQSMILHQGSLYGVGNLLKDFEPSHSSILAKISPDQGNPEWTTLVEITSNQLQDVIYSAYEIVADGDELIVGGSNITGYFYIEKHLTDGSLSWVKRYDIAMIPDEIIVLPDAYVIFGVAPMTNNWYMVKTDKEGNVLQSKTLFINPFTFSAHNLHTQGKILNLGNHLLFLDNDLSYGDLITDILLLKTDLDLQLNDSCGYLRDTAVTMTPMQATVKQITLPTLPNPVTVEPISASFTDDSLEEKWLCPDCPCATLPDFTFHVDSLRCSPDGPVAHITVCNNGGVALLDLIHVTFYDSNPFITEANPVFLSLLVESPQPGECQQISIPIDSSLLVYDKLYTLVGVEEIQSTPIDPNGFPYGFEECDYTNNLDSFILQIPPGVAPELGPDRFICFGESATLDAGNGYIAYEWVNGPTTSTYTVTAPGEYIVAATDACGRTLYDTVQVIQNPSYGLSTSLSLYPGETVTIQGITYSAPDTIVESLTTVMGCDSIITTILFLDITAVSVQCPANVTVNALPGATNATANYDLPTATTDCPDDEIEFSLLQGLPSGGQFSVGNTTVCYAALNQCGVSDTCCFTVSVTAPPQPESACDEKTNGCIRYELLDIRLDSIGQRRYRIRMTNTCASPLQFAYVQLPDGVTAVRPNEGSTYTTSSGNNYLVRNANASPFHSVRYKAINGDLNNGESDIFEYSLPQQSAPLFIHVAAKLANGVYSEAHLNTFNCLVKPFGSANRSVSQQTLHANVWPNPTSGQLFIDLLPWQNQSVQLQVLNAQGQLVLERRETASSDNLMLELPQGLANGLYYLALRPEAAGVSVQRFVLER